MRTYNEPGLVLGNWNPMKNGPCFPKACIRLEKLVLVDETFTLIFKKMQKETLAMINS